MFSPVFDVFDTLNLQQAKQKVEWRSLPAPASQGGSGGLVLIRETFTDSFHYSNTNTDSFVCERVVAPQGSLWDRVGEGAGGGGRARYIEFIRQQHSIPDLMLPVTHT